MMNGNYINDPDAIVWAALYGVPNAVEYCIRRGDDVNIVDENGRTALHNAAGEGWHSIISDLLQHGADVAAKDQRGDTPLDYAVFHRHADVADLLRKHGAVDRKGQSALQYDQDTEAIGWSSMQSLHKLVEAIDENPGVQDE